MKQDTYKIYLLPAYNPELHPDIYPNQDKKMNIAGKSGYANKRELTIVPGWCNRLWESEAAVGTGK